VKQPGEVPELPLVGRLLVSMVIGVLAAVSALLAGWGWLATLLIYSLGRSATLLALSVVALFPPRDKPAPQAERPDPEPLPGGSQVLARIRVDHRM
jgi:hypothetical protein